MERIRNIGVNEQELWTQAGRISNADHPEYLPENMVWPDLELLEEDGKSIYLVAEENDVPIGRIMIRDFFLIELAVKPEERRKGVARRLIEEGLRQIKTKKPEFDEIHLFRNIEEEEEDLLSCFIRLGFTYSVGWSKEIDLTEPFPAESLKKVEQLAADGFKPRIIKAGDKDVAQIGRLQAQYFRGFPGFMPAEQMVEIMHRHGLITVVMEKDNTIAGFTIGGVDMTIKNYRHIREKSMSFLSSIAVMEQFRRFGVGVALGFWLMEEAKRAGARKFIYGGCALVSPSWKLASKLGGKKVLHHYGFAKK